jgi:hypothetical protein
MKLNILPKQRKQPRENFRRSTLTSPQTLQRHYEAATASLREHFAEIDAWLCEYAANLWQQIHREDDELHHLCQLGVPERVYRARLEVFLALCEQAERLYCEARPNELRLPPLPADKRVAVYFALSDGSLQKVSFAED